MNPTQPGPSAVPQQPTQPSAYPPPQPYPPQQPAYAPPQPVVMSQPIPSPQPYAVPAQQPAQPYVPQQPIQPSYPPQQPAYPPPQPTTPLPPQPVPQVAPIQSMAVPTPQAYPTPAVPTQMPYGQQPALVGAPPKAVYIPVVLIIGTLLFLLITVVLFADMGEIGDLKRLDPEGMGLLSAFVYIRVIPALALFAGYVVALVAYFKSHPLFNKISMVVLASGAWLLVDAILRGLLLNHVLNANNIRSRDPVFNPVSFVISFVLLGLGFVVWWLPRRKQA